jgi:threonine dehydrogenase-like Zn-dependent dehydrogenase
MAAKALGAGKIIAADISKFRLDAARKMGADEAFISDGQLPDRLKKANGGLGADLVIACTAAPPAINASFKCADRGGRILFFAPSMPGETFPFPLYELWKDGIGIFFSYAGPPGDTERALELLRRRRLDVATMITHRLGLADTGKGFALVAMAQDSLKVIIEPQR